MTQYSPQDLAQLSTLLSGMIHDMLEAWFNGMPVQLSLLTPDPASPPAFSCERPYGLCETCGQEVVPLGGALVEPLEEPQEPLTEPPPAFKRCRWGLCQNQAMYGRRLCRVHYNQRQRHINRNKAKAKALAQAAALPRWQRCHAGDCQQPVVPGLLRCRQHLGKGLSHAG